MTPDDTNHPPAIHRITPENPPQFPCWLWCPSAIQDYDKKLIPGYWYDLQSLAEFEADARFTDAPTHWCQSPKRPTVTPDAPTPPAAAPVPVTADALALAEQIRAAVFTGESHPDAERDRIAAVLAPVVAELAAAKDDAARRKAQVDLWASAAMDGNAAIAQAVARAEAAERERDQLAAALADAQREMGRLSELATKRYVALEATDELLKIAEAKNIEITREWSAQVADLRAQLAAAQEALLEYLPELAAAWSWKRNSTPSNNREMAELDAAIDAARREGGAT